MKRPVFGNDPWLQAAAFYLRYQVFVLEQGIPPELEFDELDKQQPDFLWCLTRPLPIATIRYQKDSKRPRWIRPDHFCVAKDYRGQGIGRQLLYTYEASTKSRLPRQCSKCWSSSLRFLRKAGLPNLWGVLLRRWIRCVTMQKAFF